MKITCVQTLASVAALSWANTGWSACPPPVESLTSTSATFIPRDAPIGSVITSGVLNYDGTRSHTCADRPVELQMLAGPRVAPLAAANAGTSQARIGEHLYQTNIPGISIGATMASGRLCASIGGATIPTTERFFPLSAFSCSGNYQTRVYFWLYKTDHLPAGVHKLNLQALRVLFDGRVQSSLTLDSTVTVAGCTMPDFASNQIDVVMPPTTLKDFSGKGTVGAEKPFSIQMHSCVQGTYSKEYPWNYFQGNYAHVKLDPSRGSTVVDAAMGIVGLRPESTAKGIGVQILRQDKSPMELGTQVQIGHVLDGITALPFMARYIQVSDTTPEGGTADATVNFTVTFR